MKRLGKDNWMYKPSWLEKKYLKESSKKELTMGKDTIFIAVFSLISVLMFGQTLDRTNFLISTENGNLPIALAGGMNMPQFSEVDLNHDGTKDLFVFDRDGDTYSAYLNIGSPNQMSYQFAPDLLAHFPKLVHWALMVDYNLDGAPDIFSFSSQPGVAGVEVHKGHWQNNILHFEKLSFGQPDDVLYYPGGAGALTKLYVSNIDIPAIADVDNDGDMDILTFASNGGYVYYFKNFSAESGQGGDTLIYQLVDHCWGKFFESGLSTTITLSDDPNNCADAFQSPSHGVDLRHAGSTLLAIDLDDDGDKELFLGDVSYNNIVLLTNTGTIDNAFMTEQDTLFPAANPVDIFTFPGVFAADLNNDGHQDILAAPNLDGLSQNTHNVWWYKNNGVGTNPQFSFQQDDFLVGKMLDIGSGAHPAFADIDGDGDMDMVVGNETYFLLSGDLDSRLFLFENVGNIWEPKFQLVDDDYLGLQTESNNHWSFTPDFGDLDGDGDLDLVVGEFLGSLYYFENLAGPNQPMNFAEAVFPYKNIDVGLASAPCIVDVDEDGLVDLIIGERNGNVNFIKNVGSVGNPDFGENHEMAPNNPFWGNIDTRLLGNVAGFSVPKMWKENGVFRLFCGSQSGQLFEYSDIEGNLTGAFTKAEDYGQIREGSETYPAFQDLNNDGYRELVVGNKRGGLTAFKTSLTQPVGYFTPSLAAKKLRIAPNLVQDKTRLWFGESQGQMILMDATGRMMMTKTVINGESFQVSKLSAGIYFVQVKTPKNVYIARMVKY